MNACKAQAEEIAKAELIYDWVKKVRAQSRSGFFISHKIRGRIVRRVYVIILMSEQDNKSEFNKGVRIYE